MIPQRKLPQVTVPGLPVLIVGDLMLDRYLDGPVERISPEAPVPVLHVRRTFERAGGAGNVAANVNAMGGRAILIGAVGRDPAADLLRKVLGEADVDTATVVDTPTIPTTTKTRLLAGHSQIARFDEESPLNDAATRDAILERVAAHLPEARVAILSDYAKGVCDTAVCRAVIEGAARAGIPTIVDPKGADFSRYGNASVITPNRSEAMAVCGFPIRDSDDAIRAAESIRARFGIAAVVVTLGEQGMVVVSSGSVAVIPTQAKGVFDVTGAGDTAVARLAVALAEGLPLEGDTLAGMEAGHMPAPLQLLGLPVFKCGCGRDWGCVEAYASISGLGQYLEYLLPKYPDHELHKSNKPLKEKTLSLRTLAQNGDVLALEIFDFQAKALGIHVANLSMALDAEFVVIGGGLIDPDSTTEAFRARYLGGIRAAAEPWLFPVQRRTMQIVPATMGELSQSVGAALVALYTSRKQAA